MTDLVDGTSVLRVNVKMINTATCILYMFQKYKYKQPTELCLLFSMYDVTDKNRCVLRGKKRSRPFNKI